jgi:DNA repair protein RadC
MEQMPLIISLEVRDSSEAPPQPVPYVRPKIVSRALKLLEGEMRRRDALGSPAVVRDYLQLLLADRPHEVFAVIYLNTQHHIIKAQEIFRGTLNQTSVYPREIVIEALAVGASSVILCHNHPSGVADPSTSDKLLTDTLKQALRLVDVSVLDHFIVTRERICSMAELGMV